MRVTVDLEKCIGSGMCTTYVPQVFQLAADGSYAIVLEDKCQRVLNMLWRTPSNAARPRQSQPMLTSWDSG